MDNINLDSENLRHKIAELPNKPGVYQYKNTDGKIIYIGKAKALRNRVSQYFDNNRYRDVKTKVLVSQIYDVEIILTDSETEALLLENNLIKEHKPKYNILLKDDKSYPYIRVTNEEYPRIFFTRTVIRDGSKYFGPYIDSKHLNFLLHTIRSLFPIRSCNLPLSDDSIANKNYKVCLDYHIKKCEGPCEGLVSKEHYNNHIALAIQILNGRTSRVEEQLEEEMNIYSEKMMFEEAAFVRNRIHKLREYSTKQKVLIPDSIDRDVVAFSRDDNNACSVILTIREGKLVGKRHYYISNVLHQTDEEILRVSLDKWYMETDVIPDEIFLPLELEDSEFIYDWLEKKRGSKIDITVPKIGDKRKLINMATANAEFMLRDLHLQQAKREESVPRSVASLHRDLQLQRPPRRIECFDNSHLQGTDYVSAMVVFVDGKPRKGDYRKYKIKSFKGNDDFEAMREVVERRYSRMIRENSHMPDLIIIDGGKGQLSSAVEILDSLGLYGKIPIIGLAKRLEEVFLPEQSDSILLPKTSSSLRLLQALRDEAHRYVITFHREVRSKRTLTTELTQIDGVGDKTAQKLLRIIGSVKSIANSTLEELTKHTGISTATKIFNYFANKTQGILSPDNDEDETIEEIS